LLQESRAATLSRGGVYFSAVLFLLLFVGTAFRGPMKVPGIFFNQVVIFFGLAIGFAIHAKQPVRTFFRLRGLTARGWARSLLLGFVAWAMLFAMSVVVTRLVEWSGGKLPEYYADLSYSSFALALVTRALLPAVCEEFAFRGYLQSSLAPLGAALAALLTGLLFGVMHFSVVRLIPLAVLGWIFAIAAERSGSILPSIVMHFLNNAVSLALTYFVQMPDQWSYSPLVVAGLAVAGAALAVAALALARRFGPGDVVMTVAEDASPELPPLERKPALGLLLIVLLPGLLIYAWVGYLELYNTFWL
jgi:membrane protease YdiL (CAAX protease family)